MEIQYKFAENENGDIVHINNAIAGKNYNCPECKVKFILRKGNIRQRHFAHNDLPLNCNPEGYLHKTFKKLLYQKIMDHIKNSMPLEIRWVCNVCNGLHTTNLLFGISDAKIEHFLISWGLIPRPSGRL